MGLSQKKETRWLSITFFYHQVMWLRAHCTHSITALGYIKAYYYSFARTICILFCLALATTTDRLFGPKMGLNGVVNPNF